MACRHRCRLTLESIGECRRSAVYFPHRWWRIAMLRDENQEGERLRLKKRGGRDGVGGEHQKWSRLLFFCCCFVIPWFRVKLWRMNSIQRVTTRQKRKGRWMEFSSWEIQENWQLIICLYRKKKKKDSASLNKCKKKSAMIKDIKSYL